MRRVAYLMAAVGALAVMGAESPAMAAMGQCFDAYGRPVGPPHNTDNPPYALICGIYRRGGTCTHVQYEWARSNCGLGPPRGYRYQPQQPNYYDRGYNRYYPYNRYNRYDGYDYYNR